MSRSSPTPAPRPTSPRRATKRPRTRSQGPSLLDAFRAHCPDALAAGAGLPEGVGAGGQFADGAQATPQHGDRMDEVMQPVVKAPTEKLGRNEPCWCGSGKKFKLCHGAS